MSEIEYVYLTIPKEYVCIYHKLLILMSNVGKSIIKDCNYVCKGNNKIIIDCWNTLQSAIACKKLGKDKEADLLIKFIKSQINTIYKGTDCYQQETYVYIDGGYLKAKLSCDNDIPIIEVENDGYLHLKEDSDTNTFTLNNGDLIINNMITSSERIIGKVSLTSEGNWDSSKEYDILSLVYYNNKTYISKNKVPKNIDINNTDYWNIFSVEANSNDIYIIPGYLTLLNEESTSEDITTQLGLFSIFKKNINKLIICNNKILDCSIVGIDSSKCQISYLEFNSNIITKHNYLIQIDINTNSWDRINSITTETLIKVDESLDTESINAVQNKKISSLINKIINWH